LFENSHYKSVNFQLEAVDILVACTDGIIETESYEGKGWGQQRLEDLFSTCGGEHQARGAQHSPGGLGFCNGARSER